MKTLIIILLLLSNNTEPSNNDFIELQRDKEAMEQELKKEEIYRQINTQY